MTTAEVALANLSSCLTNGKSYSDDIFEALALAQKEGVDVEDLFVLAFHTRDIYHGRGERDLFYILLEGLYDTYPTIAIGVLQLVPEYGCWRDLVSLGKGVKWMKYVCHMMKVQIEKDELAMAAGKPVSLLAKWAPREGKKQGADLLYPLARALLGPLPTPTLLRLYRKRIAKLNAYLNTVEVNMCGKHWADIKPKLIPNRALALYRDAFLNLRCHKDEIRYPDDKDRIACRENFRTYFSTVKKEPYNHPFAQRSLRDILDSFVYDDVRDCVRACACARDPS
jgi:hypothetical protein